MTEKLKDHISEHNAKVYMLIAEEILKKKQGVFTFVLKIDGKKICDYVSYESVNGGENS
jgi:hypothetical protein